MLQEISNFDSNQESIDFQALSGIDADWLDQPIAQVQAGVACHGTKGTDTHSGSVAVTEIRISHNRGSRLDRRKADLEDGLAYMVGGRRAMRPLPPEFDRADRARPKLRWLRRTTDRPRHTVVALSPWRPQGRHHADGAGS